MDTDLVKRAIAGDEDAFSQVAAASARFLLDVAVRVVRDRGLAEDAVQQALLTIWRGLPKLRDPARYEAWAHRIVVRAALDQAHARHAAAAVPLLDGDGFDISSGEAFGGVELAEALDGALDLLTPDQRTILLLRHYAGLSNGETARVLGIPSGTAGSRLHYATQALRSAIESTGSGWTDHA